MSAAIISSPWPEQILRDQSVSRVFVCGREAEPPMLSHVVNFPRLEIPLAGCYENRVELGRQVTMVRLKPGDAFSHESIIGSLFHGRVEATTSVGNKPAIIPSIAGWARMTGYNTIFIDDRDPYRHGFQVV